jgi:hypothetical protein
VSVSSQLWLRGTGYAGSHLRPRFCVSLYILNCIHMYYTSSSSLSLLCVWLCDPSHISSDPITLDQLFSTQNITPHPCGSPHTPAVSTVIYSKLRNTGRSLRCWRSFSCQVSEHRANCFGTILICLVEAWKVRSTSHVTRSPPSLLPFICSS